MWVFAGLAVIFIGFAVYASIQARKRRDALFALAIDLGLEFDPDGGLAHERFDGFTPFGIGSARRSSNELSGTIDGTEWIMFDYRYTTGGGKSKSTHYYSIVSATMPISLPALTIRPEGVFDKLVGLAGFDDINFESEEFSRRYHVKCEDRRTCYDLIHPQMIEFLMSIEPMSWQFQGRKMVIATRGHNSPEDIRARMKLAKMFCEKIPAYLKVDRAEHSV